MKITVNQPGSFTVTPSSQQSMVQSRPNTNPTVVTLEDNNPVLRLGTLVSNTSCTALVAAEALNIASQAANTANAAANTVSITANGYGTHVRGLEFANTPSVQVMINDDGEGNAIISLFSEGGSSNGGGGGIQTLSTGIGLTGGPITIDGTIAANIASSAVQGVTKLIDSVTSTDTGNAATANAVSTVYAIAANTITQNAPIIMANVISSNTFEFPGVEISTAILTTTANGTAVGIDSFPASEFNTFKYLIQARCSSGIQALELLCICDGLQTYVTQFATVDTAGNLGDYELTLTGGIVMLTFTPTNPLLQMVTVNVMRQSIVG